MDINKYALFADVANTKNFTKTGERMGYTQPGVSHILKSMEAEFGFPLFIRTKQGVIPTTNADAILPLVRQLLSINEQLEQTISSLNGLASGHLSIASFASIARNWLPAIIYAFQEEYPDIEITLMEGSTDDIVHWLDTNQADFGFLSRRSTEGLDWISLHQDPLMAVFPSDYPLKGRKSFPVSEISGMPFISSSQGIDYDVREVLLSAGVRPRQRFSSKDDHVILSMVENHLGVTILPSLVIGNRTSNIQALPLEPFFFRELGIGIRSLDSLTPAARRFIDFVQKMMPEITASQK